MYRLISIQTSINQKPHLLDILDLERPSEYLSLCSDTTEPIQRNTNRVNQTADISTTEFYTICF